MLVFASAEACAGACACAGAAAARAAGTLAVSEQGATTLASICSRAASNEANAGPSEPASLFTPVSPPHLPPGLYFPIWHLDILYLCPGRMAAASRNYLAVGLLLFAFLLVASLAYQKIKVGSAEAFRVTAEPFESSGGPRAVTRAADCSCIPGYIPSKRGESYVCQKLGDPSKTRQCY